MFYLFDRINEQMWPSQSNVNILSAEKKTVVTTTSD